MSATTRIDTEAFEVEDDRGHREILIHTQPVRIDEHGNVTQPALGAEWRLRSGESVYPLLDCEFIGVHGKRWRKVAGSNAGR